MYENINYHILEICQYDTLIIKYLDSCRCFCKHDRSIYPSNFWNERIWRVTADTLVTDTLYSSLLMKRNMTSPLLSFMGKLVTQWCRNCKGKERWICITYMKVTDNLGIFLLLVWKLMAICMTLDFWSRTVWTITRSKFTTAQTSTPLDKALSEANLVEWELWRYSRTNIDKEYRKENTQKQSTLFHALSK